MLITDLQRINEAPDNGQLLAYTRKEVVFNAYKTVEDVKKMLSSSEVLEIHMFDDTKEYRALSTDSARYSAGFIEHIAEFDCAQAEYVGGSHLNGDVYVETCLTIDSENEIVNVLNHISYDENGMVIIDDYRLVMGGK